MADGPSKLTPRTRGAPGKGPVLADDLGGQFGVSACPIACSSFSALTALGFAQRGRRERVRGTSQGSGLVVYPNPPRRG